MKILIVGSGGREHALAWKLAQSPHVSGIVCSPGNPGMAQIATCVPAPAELSGYADLAQAYNAGLAIIGPEAPLVAGIVDHFYRRRLTIIGPTKAAAQLEGSKIFAKQFLQRAGVPTARFAETRSYEEAIAAVRSFGLPVVVKADGLAAGKGVVIAQSEAEALSAVQQLGPNLVVEEFLSGEEVSFMGLSNGNFFLPFAPTQDHKRIFDGDQGPNTGGMGAYCDQRILTAAESGEILDRIVFPTIARMQAEGSPFTGFLYVGLMMTAEGPKVLEFNVRLGDPETQALMHSFGGDFAEILGMTITGRGAVSGRSWAVPSACVVLAAEGYPDKPVTGQPITGIEEAEATGAKVFHAGTKLQDGKLVTSGGRVLSVVASGETLGAAINGAYAAAERIRFEGMQYRRDIGQKGLKRW